MPKSKKSEDDVFAFLVKGLFSTIGWTIVYYVGAWTSLLGIGAVVYHIQNRKKSKK